MKVTRFLFCLRLLGAVMFCAVCALAQEHPTINAQANTLYVSADGKYEAAADTARIQFNVSVQDDSSQKAYDLASKNVEQVRQVLRANGIDPKAATIGFFSVQPVYEWKPKQRVIGYRVTTDVTLKLKDFTKVGPITQQLADANGRESQSLNYTLENIDEAKNKAGEDAYRRARNEAEALAHASGRTLGELSYASIDTFKNMRPIVPRMMAMAAKANAAPAPTEEFTPQTVSVGAKVNVLFNLK